MGKYTLAELRAMTKEVDSGCWVWVRALSNGYGSIWNGTRTYGAHRMAAEVAYGPCPPGLDVMHSCDVRACINPEHLSFGTRKQNIGDMHARGRFRSNPPRGESQYLAKLTEAQVVEIRRLRAEGATLRSLAEVYGVSIANIHVVATGKSWRHV